jgi:hypothetical protein
MRYIKNAGSPRPGDIVWVKKFGKEPLVLVSPGGPIVFTAESLVTDDARHVSRQVVENTWVVRDKSGKYRLYPIAVLSPFEPRKSRTDIFVRVLPWFLLALVAAMTLI